MAWSAGLPLVLAELDRQLINQAMQLFATDAGSSFLDGCRTLSEEGHVRRSIGGAVNPPRSNDPNNSVVPSSLSNGPTALALADGDRALTPFALCK